jgi:phage terminase small subunit
MKQRGRKSAASLAMTPLLEQHEPVSVQPPATLSEPARAVFLDLVGNCHPEHFEDSDVGLLCQYCEAQAIAERAAAELQSGTSQAAEWALKLWEKANKIMSGLALRLRLGPQSRREKAKVARPLTWSERFCMEQAQRQNQGAPWED